MLEKELTITKFSELCGFNKGLLRQYCSSYKLNKWLKKENHKPMVFILNDESIKAFQDYLSVLDKGYYISNNNRLEKFNKGIERITNESCKIRL